MNAPRMMVPVLALLLAAAPAAAQDVGVAAAVNQSAQSTRPNAAVRTIGLGDNVVYNERIDTNDAGLVQLLLADGTTFTVGPNSSLVIDSFVYDPAAGTAQVAATLTRGVLRFIGAATSKTENGVAITTPVGVVGIRGGVTDINMSPPAGMPPHISMIFGNAVTLSQGGAVIGRLFEAGFSLAATGGGIDTVRTPAEWSSLIQQALSSNPGQNGGAEDTPGDGEVAGIAAVNSKTTPPVPPIPMPPLNRVGNLGDSLVADRTDLRDDLIVSTLYGFSGSLLDLRNDFGGDGVVDLTRLLPMFGAAVIDMRGRTPVGGTLVAISGSANCLGCLLDLAFTADGVTLVAIDNGGTYVGRDLTGSLVSHDKVVLPPGVSYCECAFLDWGFWNVTGKLELGNDVAAIDVKNGTWVVARELSTPAQLSALASTTATYRGHAVGTYSDTAAAIGPTLTAGDMAMNWSFGSRTGTIEINDFGGRDLSGNLFGDPGVAGFIGNLTDGANATGVTVGAFANDSGTVARGVFGDFFATDGSWTGSGIFMGER